jgi:hypothetical protein
VRVIGPAIVLHQVDNLVRNATPLWRGGYIDGIWQSVNLIVTDQLYVTNVFVKSDLKEDLAETEIQLENPLMKSRKTLMDVSVI